MIFRTLSPRFLKNVTGNGHNDTKRHKHKHRRQGHLFLTPFSPDAVELPSLTELEKRGKGGGGGSDEIKD